VSVRRLATQVVLAAAAASAALAPAAAQARYLRANVADGPSANIVGFGGLDLAHDGTGTVAYLKRVPSSGVVPPLSQTVGVFASRLEKGKPTKPVRVDRGQSGVSSDARIAAANGHRAVAVWINGDSLWASRRAGKGKAWSAPVRIFQGTPVQPVGGPSLDVSIFGTAHVAFTAGGDVRVARMPYSSGTWSVLPQAADVDASDAATQPDLATSADGSAIVAWTEQRDDGLTHVFERRVSDDGQLSAFPRELSVRKLRGRVGGDADTPSVSVEDDSSFAFAAFRQDFAGAGGAVSRALGRRVRASKVEPPHSIDGLGFSSSDGAQTPVIATGGDTEAVAAAARRSGAVTGAGITLSGVLGAKWFKPRRLDRGGNDVAPPITAAVAEEPSGVVAWQRGAPGAAGARIQARRWSGRRFVGLRTLSPSRYGPAAGELGLDSGADERIDFVVGFVQGGATARRVVTVSWGGPLRPAAVLHAHSRWRRTARPRLSWRPLDDVVWGPVTFQVVLDHKVVGTTRKASWRPGRSLPQGKHVVEIRQVDGRGQVNRGLDRPLWMDSKRPRVSLRRAGGGYRVTALDAASGIDVVTVVFHGGSVRIAGHGRSVRGAYVGGRGRAVRVVAVDKAGNRAVR
jgi:hypothetical protein